MVLALSQDKVMIPEWKVGQRGMLRHYVVLAADGHRFLRESLQKIAALEVALDVDFNSEVDAYRAESLGVEGVLR